MAIAVLGVRQRGSVQSSAVFRQAGASLVQVGPNFTVMTLTTASGTFTVGDTVTGGTSTATAIITSIIASGATTTLFLNTIVGTFTNETVTTTSGPGPLTGTGTLTTANIGILETSQNANWNMPQDRVLAWEGSLYCSINDYILKGDGTDPWTIAHTIANPSSQDSSAHTGLHIFTVNDAPLMGMIYSDESTGYFAVTTTDGVSFTDARIYTGSHISPGNSKTLTREVVLSNILYFYCQDSSVNDWSIMSWEPLNNVVTALGTPGGGNGRRSALDMIAWNNMLLVLTTDGSNYANIFNYAGGNFNQLFNVGNTIYSSQQSTGYNSSQWTMFDPSDGFLYVAMYNDSPNKWVIAKLTYSGGVFTAGSDVTTAVLAGTGITTGAAGRWYVVTDNVTTPGTPVVYLYYAVNDVVGTPVQVMLWNGPTTAMTVIGSTSGIEIALAHTRAGGGERIWGPGQPDVSITDIQPVVNGERLFFIGYGGGTKTIQFWWGQNSQVPLVQATLAGPVTGGGSLSGKNVINSPMDGVTVQQVTWFAGAGGDGVVNLTRAQLQPVAF